MASSVGASEHGRVLRHSLSQLVHLLNDELHHLLAGHREVVVVVVDTAIVLACGGVTVARHLQNIYTKLGVDSRTAAAAFGYQHGLV